MLKKFSPLNPDYVEKGVILKSEELTINNIFGLKCSIILARLILPPNSKIKYHTHENDSEFYLFLNSDNSHTYCKKGEGHELENDSNDPLEVLSIKIVDSN